MPTTGAEQEARLVLTDAGRRLAKTPVNRQIFDFLKAIASTFQGD
jgi:hypothetical protein